MPDISRFHSLIVLVHVVGVLLFVLAHGVSVAVLLRMRSERDRQPCARCWTCRGAA